MTEPKVWIFIPTFNGDRYLEAAICSALGQTYTNFQILISDDCSSDRSRAIALKFQSINSNILYIEHERLGLVENWNFCVQQCLAAEAPPKYIKFLCQDDLLAPTCLAEMVVAMEASENLGMAFSDRVLISETKISPELAWLANLSDFWDRLQPIQAGLDLLCDRNFLKCPDNKFGEPTNVLIRTAVFEQIGSFDPNFRQYCDLEMWIRICTYYQVGFIDQSLGSFRLHDQQASNLNQQNDLVWAEIYRVWRKILVDPIYKPIPVGLRRKILWHFMTQALAEYRRIIWYRRWNRLDPLNCLVRSLLRSDLRSIIVE
jgi:glycosyltransferase involved in cell wall biosynthesis